MIPDKPIDRTPQVPAADQTLRILRHLAGRPAPVAASAVARDLGLPRSTVYHLLTTLAAHGFVLHLREERRWSLGTAASELAGGFARQQPLARLGRPLVAALADDLGESTHLAVMSGSDVVYIVEERAPRRPTLVTEVGVRLPAHLTATGRAMLAALPREQVRALYPDRSAFSTRDDTAPASPAELRELLRDVRGRGYAIEDGAVTPGLRSVGVAVRDAADWPIAAVAATWSTGSGPEDQAAAAAVAATASALERRLRR
ncbi:IclR family transcriptional regulator [Microbacterium sp. M28]|uniref:IclR family transcriptional regulator n=1 Tax=Microbacterium sp. M28 TaxID=2962064 RepID=UPI0021F47D88|nr:IclR family transcriptional regulator [Microbacterium sp. M28]UYO97987.1 IclR family transcriptional regulator [Microbacterium sp. M28]